MTLLYFCSSVICVIVYADTAAIEIHLGRELRIPYILNMGK